MNAEVPAGRRPRSPGVVLGILTGLNGLNYLDRYVGAAILPVILTSLALSVAAGGLLQSVFIVVYSLACPFVGWLGDRRSRTRLAGAGVLVWSAATLASGLAPTYVALLAARALVGIGEASYAVVTPSLLSDYYPAERRARVLSVFYAAIPVGTALGYIVGGLVGGAFGWRAAFLVAGAPGGVLALLLLFLADPPRGRLDAQGDPPRTPLGLRPSIGALLARPSYVTNTVAQVLYTFAMGGLATWMPTYFVRERGLTLGQASSWFGLLLVVAGLLGTLVGGRLSHAVGKRRPAAEFLVGGWSLTVSLPFTVLAVLSPVPAVFWPAMFVTLLLLFINVGPLNAAMANVLPADLRARGFAANTMAIHLFGDAASPWLVGAASDRIGLTLPVLLAGGLLTAAGVVLLARRATLASDMLKLAGAPAEPAAARP